MSANPSSNDSHFQLNLSVIHSSNCLVTKPFTAIFTTFSAFSILLLSPVCIFILYHAFQQWRQSGSAPSAAAMSHSDCFTYHMVIIEMIGILGCILNCCGYFREDVTLILFGNFMFSFTWYGQISFHSLTCVERYLAVVHPITYRNLRNHRGTRIRNISIGCSWLLCVVGMSLVINANSIVLDFSILLSSLLIISFCSLSVLCVLIRPGPGEQGGDRERVDQLKRRAFYTILIILGVLIVRSPLSLSWALMFLFTGNSDCLIFVSGIWINLPSSFVLPMLFLHRAGKLVSCKNTTRRG